MTNNRFHGCSQPIGDADLDACEALLGRKLPDDFRQHYLRYNGGIPAKALFPANCDWEALEVAGYYPIRRKQGTTEPQFSLLIEHYHLMCTKKVIPVSILPFAFDPGGNFFCLDLHEGSVHFYATDAFDPSQSVAENFLKAQRRLADSFGIFMGNLIPNYEYDSDEWPE
jgi:hypothetical protein